MQESSKQQTLTSRIAESNSVWTTRRKQYIFNYSARKERSSLESGKTIWNDKTMYMCGGFIKKHKLLCWSASAEFATRFKLHRPSIAHSTKKTRRNEGGDGNMRPRSREATEREGERGCLRHGHYGMSICICICGVFMII